MYRKFLSPRSLIIILALSVFVPASASAIPVPPWEIEKIMGKEAPKFSLKDLDGRDISLSALKGNVILLNFWATWCTSCKEEMPSMNSLYNMLKERQFSVVAVSVDRSVKPVKKFLKKIPLDFIMLLDSKYDVAKYKYKVFAYPTTFLIDRNGVIREKFVGEVDWMETEVINKIEKYLEE